LQLSQRKQKEIMKLFRSKSIRSTGPKVKRATRSEGIEKKDGEDKKSADTHDNGSDDSAGKRPSSSKATAAAREEGEKQKKRKRKHEDHQVNNNNNNNKAATAGDGSKKRSRTKANKKQKTTMPLIIFTYSPPTPLQNILLAAFVIHGHVSIVLGHTVSWKMTWHILFKRFRMPLSEPIAERVAFNFASKALDGQIGATGVEQQQEQQHGVGLGAAVAATAGGHNTDNNDSTPSGGGGGPAISTVYSQPAAHPSSQQQQQQGTASAEHHHQSGDMDNNNNNSNNDDPASSGHDIHILGVEKILEVLSQKNKTEMDKEKAAAAAAAVVAATEKAAAEKESDAAHSQEQQQQQQQQQETGTAAADGIAMINEEPGLASGTRRRKRQGQTAPDTAGHGTTTTTNTNTNTHYMAAPPLIPWPHRSARSGYREFASANSYIRMQNDQLSHQVASLRSALIAADNRANAAEKELKDVLDYISSSGAINHIMSSLHQPQQQQQQRRAPHPPPSRLQPQPPQFGHMPLPHNNNNNNIRPGNMYGAPPPPPSGPPLGMPPFGVRPTMQLPGNLANRPDFNGLIQAVLTGVNKQVVNNNNNNNIGNIRPQFQPAGLGQMAATNMNPNSTNNNTMAQLPRIAANRVRSNNNIGINNNNSNAARIGVGAALTNTDNIANTAPSKITLPDSAPIREVDRIHTQMNTIMQKLNSTCTENDVDTSAARLTQLLEDLSSLGSKLPDDLLTTDKKVCLVTVKAHLMRIFNKNIIKRTTSTGGDGGGGG
jgi:hypothetical protein